MCGKRGAWRTTFTSTSCYPKTIAVFQFLNMVKAVSSKWLKDSYRELQGFHWQSGYGGFSVSRNGDAALQDYIRNQEDHHKTMSFQEEYLKLLKRFGLSYDPRDVFD
jgi:putative transposase